jgi:uncharacterized RDD family membrane protein YckC
MKCPKCGYLGFETSDRCRNCGYDFSLAVDAGPSELPLHERDGAGAPLADFVLSDAEAAAAQSSAAALDLDRIIGADRMASADFRSEKRSGQTPERALPLFGAVDDDMPLVSAPRPARPPLSVRRTTPEIPKTRARSTTPPRLEDGEFAFQSEIAVEDVAPPAVEHRRPAPVDLVPASDGRRILATAIDLGLLAAINFAVVYLTLALAGLTLNDIGQLPRSPIVGFFAILDGGYLVTFIAASGQTIGKMMTGIRVVKEDGQRVDIAGAFLRALGCVVSLLTAGLGYLPAFITTDRRALQDRIARTRVVSAR